VFGDGGKFRKIDGKLWGDSKEKTWWTVEKVFKVKKVVDNDGTRTELGRQASE
jgi:ligand-binding sensor domain-containing protein